MGDVEPGYTGEARRRIGAASPAVPFRWNFSHRPGQNPPTFRRHHCLLSISAVFYGLGALFMPKKCSCGHGFIRVHRTRFQRLLYSDVYQCKHCGQIARTLHRWMGVTFRIVFSLHGQCTRCGGDRVHRMDRRDSVDGFSKHPLSLVQGLFFAPILKCPHCRLQFHDFRPPAR